MKRVRALAGAKRAPTGSLAGPAENKRFRVERPSSHTESAPGPGGFLQGSEFCAWQHAGNPRVARGHSAGSTKVLANSGGFQVRAAHLVELSFSQSRRVPDRAPAGAPRVPTGSRGCQARNTNLDYFLRACRVAHPTNNHHARGNLAQDRRYTRQQTRSGPQVGIWT